MRGPVAELDVDTVRNAIIVLCYGGFLVAQAAAKRMLARGHGTILLTGASASVKGYAQSAPFAMGKFGLRGLAQSMARELAPKNIHVAHFVIDGSILTGAADSRAAARGPDGMLSPDAIAETYLHVHRQHRSAWTWEVELRPGSRISNLAASLALGHFYQFVPTTPRVVCGSMRGPSPAQAAATRMRRFQPFAEGNAM